MTVMTGDPLTTKINRLGLSEFLTQKEGKKSLFEMSARALPMTILSVFTQSGDIAPVSFTETPSVLSSESSAIVQTKLPQLFARQTGAILSSDQPLTGVASKRIAVLFSGGPASGGHNVIAGLKAVLGQAHVLFGVKSGPKGLLAGDFFEISDHDLDRVKNLGGFDFLGSDRTKIKTKEQVDQVRSVVQKFQLDGLIIVGGDDSNTNAAFLAESLMDLGCSVIGVPKTIDGDLQVGSWLPISFGFDTATKIYSEMVGNILQDTPSSRKYWHFVKLMGRSASHVALEVALQTKPTFTLISEEISQKNWTLQDIVTQLATIILKRAAKGINYGVVVIPEGVIEFVPEFKELIKILNKLLAVHTQDLAILSLEEKLSFVLAKLPKEQSALLGSLPLTIQQQLLLERDPHGNLQVSQIPTEQLLMDMVRVKLKELKLAPLTWGEWAPKELERIVQFKFSTNSHFFGYEGRCGAPTRFDAAYTFNLGLIAGSLILDGRTGYMAAITQLASGGNALAIPLNGLMGIEMRDGEASLVIQKALVDMQSPAFLYFSTRRDHWAMNDLFCNPGPIQLWGPVSSTLPMVVALNHGYQDLNFSFL